MTVSVICMSVRLFLSSLAYLKSHTSKLQSLSVMHFCSCWRCLVFT